MSSECHGYGYGYKIANPAKTRTHTRYGNTKTSVLLLGYGFLFTYISFQIYSPLYKIPKTLRNTLNNCLQWYYKYSWTLLIITEYLKPKRSHRATQNCSFAEFQFTFRIQKYFVWNAFSTRSRGHPIPSPRPRASAAKNKLLWVVYTHKESYKILGTFGKLCESPKGFPMTRRNLSRSSLFHSIMYKYEASPPSINNHFTIAQALSNRE